MDQNKANYWVTGSVVAVVLLLASYGVFKYIKNDTPDSDTIETPLEVTTGTPISTLKSNTPKTTTITTTTSTKTTTTVPTTTTTTTTTTVPVNNQAYKDGTYTAVGNYFTPGGEESITVTLILKNGIVTDSNVVSNAIRPQSKEFQAIFIANYKPLVIGKSISTLYLDKVSGSSLTPKGFNDAVSKIKVQAAI
ncbi:hypothetical protein H0W91_00120 [Patescibacteria group bacterium]|nr:hypothetical protein [Patescibacteria group bacterium]